MTEEFEETLLVHQKAFNSIQETLVAFEQFKIKTTDNAKLQTIIQNYIIVLNLEGFFLMSMIDMTIIAKNLHNENLPDVEIKFYLKKGYLVIYEILGTLNKHNEFIKAACKVYPKLKAKHEQLNKAVYNFKLMFAYDTRIKDIRNLVAGHFNKSFLTHYEELEKLELRETKFAIAIFLQLMLGVSELTKEIKTEQDKILFEYAGLIFNK